MKKIILSSAVFAFLSLPVFAEPVSSLAQRNCQPDDLNIKANTPVSTHCEWTAGQDAPMQLTLHPSMDVSLINATCIFTPAMVKPGTEPDAMMTVLGRKAALVKNLSIKDNVIQFQVYNTSKDNTDNLNVVFYLNKSDKDYTSGNKMTCSFAEAK